MDRHETIVAGRCETFRYCHIGGMGMTSAELKHHAKQQEWAARIQDCRSSGLPVRAWCRQEGINASTYYRWERELLTAANQAPCPGVPAVTFAELPEPKKMSRNVSERCMIPVSAPVTPQRSRPLMAVLRFSVRLSTVHVPNGNRWLS